MNGNRWQRVGMSVGGLVLLAVLFLGVVMLSNVGLRGMRLDLTQNKLYTLSSGTQQVLRDLKEPVNLYFYFSRDVAAKQSPLILPYAARVREFLEEISARAGGKVHLHVVDPQPFSDDEDRAAEFGLQLLLDAGEIAVQVEEQPAERARGEGKFSIFAHMGHRSSVSGDSDMRSLPSNSTLPPDAGCRRMSVSAIVVLPEPDSPTTPRVLPFASLNEVSLTALNSFLPNSPSRK